MKYKNVTINYATPHVGERGNHLCLVQKHTENTSCILSMAIARPSYALRLSTHGVTEADGGKKKYPLNTEYSNASEPPFYRLRATSDFNTLEPSQTQDIVMEP